jgi:hypothetical protein
VPARTPTIGITHQSRRLWNTRGPPPGVERIEHVTLTETDVHGTATGALAVVALEDPIDPFERDAQRDALLRPARHELECRTYNPDEMTIVLATEVCLNLAAVAAWINRRRAVRVGVHSHETSPEMTL